MKKIKFNIGGIEVFFNKFVEDERGYLCEVAPLGFKNPILKKYKPQNILCVSFKKIGSIRGSHYHNKNIDLAIVPTGTALWYFYDFRKESLSYKKEDFVLVGKNSLNIAISKFQNIPLKDFTIEKIKKLAIIKIPPGVYHLIICLKGNPILFEFATEPYNESDYIRIPFERFKNYKKIRKILDILSPNS